MRKAEVPPDIIEKTLSEADKEIKLSREIRKMKREEKKLQKSREGH